MSNTKTGSPLTRLSVLTGGGIIGCCSAYYLTRHPSYNPAKHRITLLEATKIAGGASGKAGGLLALWAYPSSLVPLSFRCHEELAAEHDGPSRWGYRRCHSASIVCQGRQLKKLMRDAPKEELKDASKQEPDMNSTTNGDDPAARVSLRKRDNPGVAKGALLAAGIPPELDWVAPESAMHYSEMGNKDKTAQVHPYLFTTSIAALAQEAGVKIIDDARVSSMNYNPEAPAKTVNSVTYTRKSDAPGAEPTILPAETVILAAGPWTATLLPSVPMKSLRAHSITVRPSRPVSAFALFTEIDLPKNYRPGKRNRATEATPEIYARPNNEIYACGEGDELVALPPSSDVVEVDHSRTQDIADQIASISDELRDGVVTVRQACYLPVLDTHGGPLIGWTRVKGLLLATGHTCWGIQNGPGTGKLVAEFVYEGVARSAKIENLDPKKALRM